MDENFFMELHNRGFTKTCNLVGDIGFIFKIDESRNIIINYPPSAGKCMFLSQRDLERGTFNLVCVHLVEKDGPLTMEKVDLVLSLFKGYLNDKLNNEHDTSN